MALRLAAQQQPVLDQIAAALRLFCFIDYDGTLANIVASPELAYPHDKVPELLLALTRSPGVDVAIVSGRTLASLHALLEVPGLYYVGTHGVETQLPNGAVSLANGVAVIRSLLPRLKRQLEGALQAFPGVVLEDKGAALACHYRRVAADDAASVRDIVAQQVRAYRQRGTPLDILHGHQVVEIRPLSINKGKAVSELFARYGSGALAIYIGDDQTDESAFQALPANAITVRVGTPQFTAARYQVADPEEVVTFLAAILKTRQAAS